MNASEITGSLLGFASRIDTPFGELCSLACDMHRIGRTYTPIEESITKLTPMLAQRNARHSFQGNLVATLATFSTNSILEFFGTTSKSHSIEDAGSHAMSPYTYLSSKLIAQQQQQQSPESQSNAISRPQIYIGKHEEYSNVLPWKFSNCDIHPIDFEAEFKQQQQQQQQQTGVQISPKLVSQLSKHTQKNLHIVSINAVSPYSGQKLSSIGAIVESVRGLRAELEQLNKDIRIYIVVDVTRLVSFDKVNMRGEQSYFKHVDFFVLSGVQLLGGGPTSTNIVISNKRSVDESAIIRVPRYTNNADVRKLYRLALQLQLIEQLNVESLLEKENQNMAVFLEAIQSANAELKQISPLREIVISGINSKAIAPTGEQGYLGGLNLNVYVPTSEVFDPENKSYLHPSLVCQILHDLFGILAVPTTHVYLEGASAIAGDSSKGNNNNNDDDDDDEVDAAENLKTEGGEENPDDQTNAMKQDKSIAMMMNLPGQLTGMLGALGISESSIGGVCLSISFLHSAAEVTYIANSLKMICEKGEEFIKFYDKKTFTMNNFSFEKYDFGLHSMAKVGALPADFVFRRESRYEAQESVAKTVFKNLNRYFSVNDGYSKEKTEQHKRKDYAGTMPALWKTKLSKEDELTLSLSSLAIKKAQAMIKNELAKIKVEKKKVKSEPVIEETPPPPPPPKIEAPVEPVGPTKEEVEAQMKAILAVSLSESKEQEAAQIAKAMDAIRREMEERMAAQAQNSEKIVFEDLPPSVMFKNVLDHREKRYRHLRYIFNHYASMTQAVRKSTEPQRIKLIPSGLDSPRSSNESIGAAAANAAQTVSQTHYVKFCLDFQLQNELVDVNVLCSIFAHSLAASTTKAKPVATTVHVTKEMLFTEFLNSLEKLSLVFFHNHHMLLTNFDKMEALYQFMQIDDILMLKKKMTNQASSQQQQQQSIIAPNLPIPPSPFIQPSQHSSSTYQNNYNSNYNSKHHYQSQQHHLSASPPSRSSRFANELSSSTYLSTVQPGRGQQSLSQDRRSQQSSKYSNEINRPPINWNNGNEGVENKVSSRSSKHRQGGEQFLFMKNKDHLNISNNNASTDMVSLESASQYGNHQNSRYLPPQLNSPPSASSKYHPINGQQRNQSNKAANGAAGAGAKSSAALLRIKEIEEAEKKKQQDLLAFLQSNQQNKRYKPYKK